MTRPTTIRGVVNRKVIERTLSDGEPYREHLKLECGHTVVRAERPQRARRVVCPECSDAQP